MSDKTGKPPKARGRLLSRLISPVVWAIAAIIFAIARSWLAAALFACFSLVSAILTFSKFSPRTRMTARLFRFVSYMYILVAICLVVAIDFAIHGHWAEFGIFVFFATIPGAAAISPTGFFRKVLERSRERNRIEIVDDSSP